MPQDAKLKGTLQGKDKSGQPMNRQIALILRERIVRGDYAESGLAPERSLMVEFGVSRQTVRAALQRLEHEGLIDRRVGSGTTVSPRATAAFAAMGSLSDLLAAFSIADSITISAQVEPASLYPEPAATFGIPPSGEIFRLVRILVKADGPYCVSQLFTLPGIAKKLAPEQIPVRPFIEMIEECLGQVAAKVQQSMSAILADAKTAGYLKIQPGVPLVALSRIYRNSDDEPMLQVEIANDPNRNRPKMDFIRAPTARATPTAGD